MHFIKKKLFQKTKKNDVKFRFLIFLFIITETKIHLKFWEKMHSFLAFASSRHNIPFSLLLRIMGFEILLLGMTLNRKLTYKKNSSNTVFEMTLLLAFKYAISLQLKVQEASFCRGIMHSFLIPVCYIRLVYRTSNLQIAAIALTSLVKDTFCL